MTAIGTTPDIEVESPIPSDLSVEVEIPPFASPVPVDAILVSGPKGQTGPPGSAGEGFEHIQDTPSASWSFAVPDGFGRRPNVAIYVDDENVEADVTATQINVNIQFPSPVAGSAVLS